MVETSPALTLGRLWQILRRGWIVIIAFTVVGGAAAFVVSSTQTPVYQASASVYFSLTQGATSSDLNQGSAYTQAQMLSFAQLSISSITLDRVISDLALTETSKNLARDLSVSIPQNTVILEITASSTSASKASQIANSVAANLSDVVVQLAPSVKGQAPAVSARVIEPAVPPLTQSSPSKSRDTLLGGVLGLLIGAVGCIVFALADSRVRSPETLTALTEIPLLGQIPRLEQGTDARPVMARDPNGDDAESFRRVRAGLRFAAVDKNVRVILVTSGFPAEGKTTLAVNLALATAETGVRVLLVDADFRRPQVAERFELDGTVGLTTVLVGGVKLEDARRPYGTTSLDLLLSGDVPPNPSELLSSSRMSEVLSDLSSRYDLVIVDTAPVLSVADAALLAPHVDLVLLVADSSKTRKAQLTRSIRALEGAGAHISGVVLNRVKKSKRRDDYYYAPNEKDESRMAKLMAGVRRPSGGEAEALTPAAIPVVDAAPQQAEAKKSSENIPALTDATSGTAPVAAVPRKPRLKRPAVRSEPIAEEGDRPAE